MPFVPNPLVPNAIITTEKVLVIPANPLTNPPTVEMWSIKLKCELSTPINHEQSLGKYRWLLTENADCNNPGVVNEEHETMDNWFVLPNKFKVGDKIHVRGTVYIGGISPAPIANWSEPPLMITIEADMVAAPAAPARPTPTPVIPPAPVVPAPVATPPTATPPVVVVPAPVIPSAPVSAPAAAPTATTPTTVATPSPTGAPATATPTTAAAPATPAAAPRTTTAAAPTTAAPTTTPPTPPWWKQKWAALKTYLGQRWKSLLFWGILIPVIAALITLAVKYMSETNDRVSSKVAGIGGTSSAPAAGTPAPSGQNRPTVTLDPHASQGHPDQIVAAGSSPGIPVSMTYNSCAIVTVSGNNINVVNVGKNASGPSNILFGASSIIGSMPAVPTAAPTAPTNPPTVVVPPPAWPSNGPATAFANLPMDMTHGQDEGCIVLALSPGEDVEYKNTASATIAAIPVEWKTTAFEVACDGVVQTEGRLTTNGFQTIRIHCTAPTGAGPQKIKIRLKKL